MTIKHAATVFTLALVLGSSSVFAASFSFTGNFTHDDDVQFFNFSIASDSTAVVINTWSLNGGTNAAGNVITGGGFDPYLAIYDQNTGEWITDTVNKLTGAEANISSFGALLSGNYILALTQFDNVAADLNLAGGFAADYGLATFGVTPFTLNGGGGSGHWAVDISEVDNASVSSVPVPGALPLLLSGLLGLRAITRGKARITPNHPSL